MAILLSRILSRPLAIRTRERVPRNHIYLRNILEENHGFSLQFDVNSMSDPAKSYNCSIWLDGNEIGLTSKVEVFCTCQSFQYQFETVLSNHGGLYGLPRSHKLPKKQTIAVCKHLESIFTHLLINKNIKTLKIRGNYGK